MIFIIPFIAALIGWITNKLAVWMLFNPKKQISILGIKFQGLIPKNRLRIADNFAKVVSNQLVNLDIILEENREIVYSSILSAIEKQVTELIQDKLAKTTCYKPLFKIGLEGAKTAFMAIIASHLPDLIERMKKEALTAIDINSIVKDKISNYSDAELENMFLTLARREFKMIEYTGLILGFIIGCVQSVILIAGL